MPRTKRTAETAPPRRRLPPPERRQRIVDGAVELFARKGYNDTSMADIAAAAGVTPPVIYRHFDSKRELFLAVLHEQTSVLAAAIGDAADPASAPLEQRLIKAAGAIVNFVAERPSAWRLLRMTPPGDPAIAAAYNQLHKGTRDVTAKTTASDPNFTAPPGIEREAAAQAFGHLQWATYDTLGDWVAQHPGLPRSDALRIFMDFIWVGLERHSRGKHWNPKRSPRR